MKDIINVLPDIKLRFNVDHPTFEECYAFGYECALAEISEEENPFKSGTKENEQWQEGWWAGFYGEEPMFELSGTVENTATISKLEAANEETYQDVKPGFFTKMMEITGEIAILAMVGYQLIDLVA